MLSESSKRRSNACNRTVKLYFRGMGRNLNLAAIYPVEMIPYCDRLAKIIGDYPSIKRCGSIWAWSRVQPLRRPRCITTWMCLPAPLVILLMMLIPIDWA
ncbi:hypothetical protein CEE69_24120 [Rhodopirellula bahusiensis]|uniref:Uncharacterized protein n=1 Tax=Rhodopirellula bahusiensis TaxID=2014065 RepID=A0A2G1W156_9BACT|nr:hypothetical protein CEE69_24120 [Rhodopirellula bahusiensis]